MLKEKMLRKEIDFANRGAGTYLFCDLWDMMDDHDLTVWDFHNKTDAWKEAVAESTCEDYWDYDYETLWPKLVATAFSVWTDECGAARKAAKKIKKFLISEGHESIKDVDFDAIIFEGVSFNYVTGRMNPESCVTARMNPQS